MGDEPGGGALLPDSQTQRKPAAPAPPVPTPGPPPAPAPVRPQISLQLPPLQPACHPQGPGLGGGDYRYYTGPLTPQGDPIELNFFHAYPDKAGEFVSKQFNSFRDFTMNTAKSGLSLGEKVSIWFYSRIWALSRKWFTHFFLFLVIAGYSLLGGFLFQAIEGTAEKQAMVHIEQERTHLLLLIRGYLREMEHPGLSEDEARWEGRSRAALRQYEAALLEHFKEDTHIMSKGDRPTWDFWSSVFYCGTIFTTIGYGHLAPVTTTGRALTIAYSIIGIPLFLILLADFGKLFTRSIKFGWAFVRRFYYTGTCRKARRSAPVQEMMKGVQIMYDLAHLRRPSQVPGGEEPTGGHQVTSGTGGRPDLVTAPLPPPPISPSTENPPTPALSTFAIDDEFNLPISVAITILLVYIFLGALVFWFWEDDWTFFEAFYFVFISMSTIGFGDLVPQNQMYMMASIVYLAFGLALTSMCINVVQEKLSDTFRQASAKIGATIGLKVSEDDGTISPVTPTRVELFEIHPTFQSQPQQGFPVQTMAPS